MTADIAQDAQEAGRQSGSLAAGQDVPYVAHVLNCNCRQAPGQAQGKVGEGDGDAGKKRRIGVLIYLHARVFVTVGQ